MAKNYTQKLTPAVIMLLHELLQPDAGTRAIGAAAQLTGLSYSTVWHIVRFYCRHQDAEWRKLPTILTINVPEEAE